MLKELQSTILKFSLENGVQCRVSDCLSDYVEMKLQPQNFPSKNRRNSFPIWN